MAAEIDYEKMAAANAKYAQANPSTGKDPLASLGGPADKLGKQLGALYDWVQGGEKVFQNLTRRA